MADRIGRGAWVHRLADLFGGRRVRGVWLSAALVAVLCTGCSPSEADNAEVQLQSEAAPAPATTEPATTTESTTTTAPEPTTTTIVKPSVEVPTSWDSLQDEIFGRYLLYLEAYHIAAGPPMVDPNYPDFDNFVAPEALAKIRESFAQFPDDEVFIIKDDWRDRRLLRVGELPAEIDEGTVVPMQDCWLSDYDIEKLDGTPVSKNQGADLLNVWMIYQGGEWIVNRLAIADEKSSGYEECKDLG